MASDVDICNLALGNLGDTATVATLDPPEGSAQAEHCARFYPIARDSLLEKHAWGFATKRVQLAQLSNTASEWRFAYAQPSDALNILAVLPPNALDDYSESFAHGHHSLGQGKYTPQPFSCEIDGNNNDIILTNQPGAVLRYTCIVTDTTKFSPLFVLTLAAHLSSMLAGPLLKGDVGAAEAKRCAQMAQLYLSQAITSDVNQRKVEMQQNVDWMAAR